MLQLHIQPDHDRAIRDHGRRAFPHECCGFLLGRDGDGGRIIDRVIPATNSRGEEELHNRFTITPEAFMAADKAARAAKLDVLGFYHSHPNAPARPSAYDLDHAWPVYSYIIVSVRDGEPREMTSWVLRDDRSGFDEQGIVIGELPLP
jgi:proteasome lid subunit RPN8/RPN11